MSDYIATFIVGFEEIVEKQIKKDLPGTEITNVYEGLIHFKYRGDCKKITKLEYLNNIFFVIRNFRGRNLSFENMIKETKNVRNKFLVSNGTYRVRFSKENQFVKVDKRMVAYAEKNIEKCSKLKINRVNPKTEIWFIIRTEGVGFFCQLFSKRKVTEKKLQKGELRPELAYLMCACVELSNKSIVMDPFCGYGAIPQQLVEKYHVKKVVVSDIDRKKIEYIQKAKWSHNSNVIVGVKDATKMDNIQSNSIDIVITDPPWGYYEDIDNIEEFYVKMLNEILRITKKKAKVVILSARKEEMNNACEICNIKIAKRFNILVNGKKAAIYILNKEE